MVTEGRDEGEELPRGFARIERAFLVLAPRGRRFGIFESAEPGDQLEPDERVVLQVAEVAVGPTRCFAAHCGSPSLSDSDVEAAARSLAGEDHLVVLTPWTEHPMWKNASMPARLVHRGASATPVEDAACAVAEVLAAWGWDEREWIPVEVDGVRVVVRMGPVTAASGNGQTRRRLGVRSWP